MKEQNIELKNETTIFPYNKRVYTKILEEEGIVDDLAYVVFSNYVSDINKFREMSLIEPKNIKEEERVKNLVMYDKILNLFYILKTDIGEKLFPPISNLIWQEIKTTDYENFCVYGTIQYKNKTWANKVEMDKIEKGEYAKQIMDYFDKIVETDRNKVYIEYVELIKNIEGLLSKNIKNKKKYKEEMVKNAKEVKKYKKEHKDILNNPGCRYNNEEYIRRSYELEKIKWKLYKHYCKERKNTFRILAKISELVSKYYSDNVRLLVLVEGETSRSHYNNVKLVNTKGETIKTYYITTKGGGYILDTNYKDKNNISFIDLYVKNNKPELQFDKMIFKCFSDSQITEVFKYFFYKNKIPTNSNNKFWISSVFLVVDLFQLLFRDYIDCIKNKDIKGIARIIRMYGHIIDVVGSNIRYWIADDLSNFKETYLNYPSLFKPEITNSTFLKDIKNENYYDESFRKGNKEMFFKDLKELIEIYEKLFEKEETKKVNSYAILSLGMSYKLSLTNTIEDNIISNCLPYLWQDYRHIPNKRIIKYNFRNNLIDMFPNI